MAEVLACYGGVGNPSFIPWDELISCLSRGPVEPNLTFLFWLQGLERNTFDTRGRWKS